MITKDVMVRFLALTKSEIATIILTYQENKNE